MISPAELKKRFLKDTPSMRLGAIASDLARLASLARARQAAEPQAFQNVLFELKLFTEWAADDLSLEVCEMILNLQRKLSRLDTGCWEGLRIENEMRRWSDKFLQISGLT